VYDLVIFTEKEKTTRTRLIYYVLIISKINNNEIIDNHLIISLNKLIPNHKYHMLPKAPSPHTSISVAVIKHKWGSLDVKTKRAQITCNVQVLNYDA